MLHIHREPHRSEYETEEEFQGALADYLDYREGREENGE